MHAWTKDQQYRALIRGKAHQEEPRVRHYCTMGVGCEEYGICYALAHGSPERCGMSVYEEKRAQLNIEQLLPAEFLSGNEIEVERATLTRERMLQILEQVVLLVSEDIERRVLELAAADCSDHANMVELDTSADRALISQAARILNLPVDK